MDTAALEPMDQKSTSVDLAFQALRRASRHEPYPALELRQDRLKRLAAMLAKHARAFESAIDADFGHRSSHETRLAEAFVVQAGITHVRGHLRRWMRAKNVSTQLHFWPGKNRLIPQPLGVVGVVSPWNYPLLLTLGPVVGAVAAGNVALIKPSELTPRCSESLGQAIAEFFSSEELVVVQGGAEVARQVTALPFDHLVFTGSTRVGRLVAETAGRNLTPVTLELGGKSPAIVDASADVAVAARRIAYGKLLNAGQTCIAPDYVLCQADRREAFVIAYFDAVERLYGSDPNNPDYTSIIDSAHYARFERLIDDARAKGARVEMARGITTSEWKAVRKFPPCVVLEPTRDMLVGQEEIFGPVLPIFTYGLVDDAIRHVNAGDRPLALYWFGEDARARDRMLKETVSGGVTINDCLLHIAQENQPFGGVGASGTGAYHGEWGFRSFSKEKPVFFRPKWSGLDLFLPPYGATFDWMMRLLRRLV